MVGLRFLVPSILVRVQVWQLEHAKPRHVLGFFVLTVQNGLERRRRGTLWVAEPGQEPLSIL